MTRKYLQEDFHSTDESQKSRQMQKNPSIKEFVHIQKDFLLQDSSENKSYSSSVSNKELLKKYRVNLEKKAKLEQMSDLERDERRYGMLVNKGAAYLNP